MRVTGLNERAISADIAEHPLAHRLRQCRAAAQVDDYLGTALGAVAAFYANPSRRRWRGAIRSASDEGRSELISGDPVARYFVL